MFETRSRIPFGPLAIAALLLVAAGSPALATKNTQHVDRHLTVDAPQCHAFKDNLGKAESEVRRLAGTPRAERWTALADRQSELAQRTGCGWAQLDIAPPAGPPGRDLPRLIRGIATGSRPNGDSCGTHVD
jgi:hypothetical protein